MRDQLFIYYLLLLCVTMSCVPSGHPNCACAGRRGSHCLLVAQYDGGWCTSGFRGAAWPDRVFTGVYKQGTVEVHIYIYIYIYIYIKEAERTRREDSHSACSVSTAKSEMHL